MKIREERQAEKEWRQQEAWERRKMVNRKRAIIERRCFVCRGFGHMASNCRNMESRGEEGSIKMPSNKFEVLRSRVINVGDNSRREMNKNSSKRVEKEEKLLKEVTVKIELKQKDNEE